MIYEMIALSNSFDEVLDEIKKLDGPIGIMIFGPESRLKSMIYHKVVNSSDQLFGNKIFTGKNTSLAWIRMDRVSAGNGIIVRLNGDASSLPGERHRAILGLKHSGMKSIVGIYVKSDYPSETFENGNTSVEKHPPSADGLTMLITVSTSNLSPLV